MSETPLQIDELTPPIDAPENVLDPNDETVEISKNQEPVLDEDEEA